MKQPITLIFGDKASATAPDNYGRSSTILLRQTHGTDGHRIDAPIPTRTKEGDYLITNIPGITLGVLTADCLPIIFYDPATHAAGIAHAGWRGSIGQIARQTLTHMQEAFGTHPTGVRCWLGPAARSCCYEVDAEFGNNITDDSLRSASILKRSNRLVFDNTRYTQEVLVQTGVDRENINTEHNRCTICNPRYCSHRREPENPARQMTMVRLN